MISGICNVSSSPTHHQSLLVGVRHTMPWHHGSCYWGREKEMWDRHFEWQPWIFFNILCHLSTLKQYLNTVYVIHWKKQSHLSYRILCLSLTSVAQTCLLIQSIHIFENSLKKKSCEWLDYFYDVNNALKCLRDISDQEVQVNSQRVPQTGAICSEGLLSMPRGKDLELPKVTCTVISVALAWKKCCSAAPIHPGRVSVGDVPAEFCPILYILAFSFLFYNKSIFLPFLFHLHHHSYFVLRVCYDAVSCTSI